MRTIYDALFDEPDTDQPESSAPGEKTEDLDALLRDFLATEASDHAYSLFIFLNRILESEEELAWQGRAFSITASIHHAIILRHADHTSHPIAPADMISRIRDYLHISGLL